MALVDVPTREVVPIHIGPVPLLRHLIDRDLRHGSIEEFLRLLECLVKLRTTIVEILGV